MPQVQAWQCPHTGRLWALEDKVQYQQHLRELASGRRHQRRITEIRENANGYLQETLWDCRDVKEIAQWFLDHGEWLTAYHQARNTWGNPRRKPWQIKFTSMEITGKWHESVSNSHTAPLGKPTNWHRLFELPRGYPGFTGSIRFTLENTERCPGFHSDLFAGLRVNTGSGGGVSPSQYELNLFDDDWPGLVMQRVFDTLASD